MIYNNNEQTVQWFQRKYVGVDLQARTRDTSVKWEPVKSLSHSVRHFLKSEKLWITETEWSLIIEGAGMHVMKFQQVHAMGR